MIIQLAEQIYNYCKLFNENLCETGDRCAHLDAPPMLISTLVILIPLFHVPDIHVLDHILKLYGRFI